MQRTHIIQHLKSNSSINNWKELMFFHRGHTDGQLVYEKMLNMTNHQGNANQNHKEMHFIPVRMSVIKMQHILARMWRKANPRALLVGTGAATMENSTEITQKIKNIPNT